MGKVIQFPTKDKQDSAREEEMMQNRLDEIEVENRYITDDVAYLQKALQNNVDESVEILKKFAIINGENTPVMNEWGDDFEFTPDFDLPNDKMDNVVDSIADAAKKLEDAVSQLVLDLNINPENEDK